MRISRLANFKNRSFSSGQGVVQIEKKVSMESRHSSQSVKQKEFFFGIACLGKKFKFSYGNLHFFHRVNNDLFKSN